VPKSEFATRDWYDVWFPTLAPSAETMRLGQDATTPAQWVSFTRKYRSEMAMPEARNALALLAALSHKAELSVGCYCAQEAHCHRSVLRALLLDNGARMAGDVPDRAP
jgi:uncharacterized protein YeaO (DUF488 family)